MTEKITVGRAIVASIPVVLFDLFVFWMMTTCVGSFSCLLLPLYILMGIAFVGTAGWIYYLLGCFEEEEKEVSKDEQQK